MKKVEGRSNILIISVAVLLLGVFGYIYFFTSLFGAITPVTVSLKWLNQAQFAGMYVAQEEGLYRKNRLDVQFNEYDFETSQIELLLAGSSDFAVISAEELLSAVSDNVPITAIAAIYQVSPYSIVALEASGIAGPADFKGKILGDKGGKLEDELFYLLLLDSVGLDETDVTIKKVGFEKKEVNYLLDGDVDTVGLYRTDQLYFFKTKNVPYTLIRPEQFSVNIYNDVLVARNDFIESNPELVKGFVHATIKGWEAALEDPDEAVKHTLKYVTNETYQDAHYEKFILLESAPLIQSGRGIPIGSMNFAKWNRLYNELLQKGFLTNEFEVDKIFTVEFLP